MLRSNDGTQTKRLAGLPGDRYPTTGFQKKRALYTATGGETSINLALLTPSLSYTPGMSQIAVKRSSGGALIAGIDFLETSTTTITFPTGDALIAGEIVEISQEAMVTGIAALAARPDCYTATATALQTLVTADFSWQYGLNPTKSVGGVKVFVQGSLWKRGVEYTEINLGTTNTNQILVADGFIGGEDIVMLPAYQAIDQTSASSSLANQSLASLQSMMTAGSQGFVDQSSDMISVPNTTIVGRAKIPNLANDLRASLGVERIQTQAIVQLQNEFGPNGESVFGVVNDDRGLIRFVGTWYASSGSSLAYGAGVTAPGTTSYVEVTFYGTGINLLYDGWSTSGYYPTIDGGTEQAVLVGSSNAIIAGRNYSPNVVLTSTACHGLSLGVHTVKFRSGRHVFLMGFEILTQPWATANTNSTTTVTLTNLTGIPATLSAGVPVYGAGIAAGTTVVSLVGSTLTISQAATATATGVNLTFGSLGINPGTGYINGQKYVNSLVDSVAYNTGVTGVRGGRVVRYLNSDGTVGQAFTAVNAAPATLTSADHTNEEVARTYHWREFGAGRTSPEDDFSRLTSTNRAAAFTLDDGTTTLVLSSGASSTSFTDDRLVPNAASSDYIIFAFVGTGLDINMVSTVSTGNNIVTVDGGVVVAPFNLPNQTIPTNIKIISGLPYGTHAVKIIRGGAGTTFYIKSFTVYGPKKPTIPATALELCDYNVMATYARSSTVGVSSADPLSTGVLFKSGYREHVYKGTWTGANVAAGALGGTYIITAVSTDYVEYTFFGTGIEFHTSYAGSPFTATVLLDGSAYSGSATVAYNGGTVPTWTGGVFTCGGTNGASLQISSLTLGVHTVRLIKSTPTDFVYFTGVSIITPIHAVKSNLYADLQNTLPVGSCSLMDSRKTSMIKEILPAQKAWAQAVGVSSSPTTASTSPVPLADMSVTIKTSGGPLKVTYSSVFRHSGVNQDVSGFIYVNGSAVGTQKTVTDTVATADYILSDTIIVPCSSGINKVDIYWSTSTATLTATGTKRNLTVQEL